MNEQRDHIIEVLYLNYRTIKDNLYPILTLLLGLLGANHFYENTLKIGFICVAFGTIIYSLLLWYCKIFSFDSKRIVVQEGIFTKRKQEISINRVKSIYISDSFIKRMLGISNFHIELIGGREVSFVLNNKSISEIKQVMFQEFLYEEQHPPANKITFFQCLLLATTSVRTFLTALSFTLALTSLVLVQSERWLETEGKIQEKKTLIEIFRIVKDYSIDVWISLIPFFLGLFVITLIVASVYVYVRYQGLHIEKGKQHIQISYGLFAKKRFQIPLKEIRSVCIIQPLWFQPFRYVQIKINYIGMDEHVNQDFFIQPIIKGNKASEFIEQYIPFFKNEKITEKANITVLPDYLIRTAWKPTLLFLIFVYWYPIVLYSAILLPFFLLVGYLEWKHVGFNFNDKYVIHSYYYGLKSTKMITLKKYIQHTGISCSVINERRKVMSCHYSVYSESVQESYSCYGINNRYKRGFLEYL